MLTGSTVQRDTFRFRNNNLDILRLAAALQVVCLHSVKHLSLTVPTAVEFVLQAFPGVPVFFFVSGLLIYRSYENASSITQFAVNRALRLFPGLVVCVLLTLLSILLAGYSIAAVPNWQLAAWLAGQASILPFWNPGWMREYGIGVANGSLWTIAVEIQFYIATPMLWWLVRPRSDTSHSLLKLALLLAIPNVAFLAMQPQFAETTVSKLVMVSALPWLYMFVLGAAVSRRNDIICAAASRPLWQWLGLYLVLAAVTRSVGLPLGNELHPLLMVALVPIVLNIGWARPSLAARLLRGHDISFGVYIYHMPVINYLLEAGWAHGYKTAVATLLTTVLFAFASWVLIERPALRLKTQSLRPV